MTYAYMNGTLVGSDLTQIFVYINSITAGLFTPMMVFSFFLVILISSLVMQQRFTGNIRPETSFAAASFSTLGLSVILASKAMLSVPILFLVIFITFISVWWLISSSDS